MSIRGKTLLMIAITTGGVLVLLYSLFLVIVLSRFAELERSTARADVEKVLNALHSELAGMSLFNNDWAAWDDTYEFLQDADPAYPQANLMDETFSGARMNLMVFVDQQARVVFAKAFDWRAGRPAAVPPDLLGRIRPGDALLCGPDGQPETEGILLTSEGALLLSAQAVLTSTNDGPCRGTLIMGRYLDEPKIAELARLTDQSLEIRRFHAPDLPEDYRTARQRMEQGQAVTSGLLSPQRIAAYASVDDLYGSPALILRVDLARDILAHGRRAMRYLVLSLAGTGLVFCAVIMLLLELAVVRRLTRLNEGVEAIGRRGDPSARLELHGQDELASLGGSINAMLRQLEQVQQLHRALLQAIPDLILEVSPAGEIVAENGRRPALTRSSEGQPRSLEALLPAALCERSLREAAEVLRTGRPGLFEYEHVESGEQQVYEVRVVSVGSDRVLEILRDVTERRQAEETKKKETLLKEVHHRVKNNLQVISSLLYLQGRQMRDPSVAAIFEENRNRIRSIALVHEKLYQEAGSGGVDLSLYLRDVVNNLFAGHGGALPRVSLSLEVAPGLVLGMDTAILCGLITTELVSNALRHAFPSGEASTGRIRVALQRSDDRYLLSVGDTGVGLREGFDLQAAQSMGLMLVQLLARQLDGRLWLEEGPGAHFVLSFPDTGAPPVPG